MRAVVKESWSFASVGKMITPDRLFDLLYAIGSQGFISYTTHTFIKQDPVPPAAARLTVLHDVREGWLLRLAESGLFRVDFEVRRGWYLRFAEGGLFRFAVGAVQM